jgi:hypothetical protein
LRRIAHARDGWNCYAYGTVPPAAAAGLSAGAIAGIVIGCAVGAAGLAVGAAFLGLHLKRKNEAEKSEQSTDATATNKPKNGVDIYPSVDGRHQSITARAPAIKKTPQ